MGLGLGVSEEGGVFGDESGGAMRGEKILNGGKRGLGGPATGADVAVEILEVVPGTALEARLDRSGASRRLTPARFRAGCWLSAMAGGLLAALLWRLLPAAPGNEGGATGIGAALVGLGLFTGATLPVARLRDRALARQRSMLRHLPFVLDLVTMSVEAGLNLSAALAQAVDRGPPGPLRDELARITNGYSPAMIDQACSLALTYAHSDGRAAFTRQDLLGHLAAG